MNTTTRTIPVGTLVLFGTKTGDAQQTPLR